MNKEKIFADGFNFKRRDNAPDFVVGNLSLKAEEAIQFIKDRMGQPQHQPSKEWQLLCGARHL